ncbi:hypothetical protein T492DRAFT_895457 [Pavlovales sp. CCMP2436]|nr:hypothetical protein T492DRAFT_895457 [Pavlovales sp. CCMP2436]
MGAVRGARWWSGSPAHLAWDNAIVSACALLPASHGRAVWAFPPELAERRMRAHHRRCAPGRDPAALYELLDALRAGGARATFFVTAGYAECLPDERSRWATGRPAQWPRMAPRVKAEWRAAVRTALHQLFARAAAVAANASAPAAAPASEDLGLAEPARGMLVAGSTRRRALRSRRRWAQVVRGLGYRIALAQSASD